MKKSLQNLLTSILGLLIIIAAVASFFITKAQEFMTPTYYVLTFLFGLTLLYVKSEKSVELIKTVLSKFTK